MVFLHGEILESMCCSSIATETYQHNIQVKIVFWTGPSTSGPNSATAMRQHSQFGHTPPFAFRAHSIHSDIFRRFILPLKTRSGTHEYPHLAELARALKHRDIMVYCPDVSGTVIHAAGEIFTAEIQMCFEPCGGQSVRRAHIKWSSTSWAALLLCVGSSFDQNEGKILGDDEIIENIVVRCLERIYSMQSMLTLNNLAQHNATSTFEWSIHCPIFGWYMRLHSSTFSPCVLIPLTPY